MCVCVLVAQLCLFATPRTIARQASLSMEFSRQEYWSGLPFPPPEKLPNPGIEPWSPSSQAYSLPFELQGSLNRIIQISNYLKCKWIKYQSTEAGWRMNTWACMHLHLPHQSL